MSEYKTYRANAEGFDGDKIRPEGDVFMTNIPKGSWMTLLDADGKDVDEPVLPSTEPGPLDGSVDELTLHLKGVSDVDAVQKLIDAETAGKSRKGALAVLEARRDELLA